MELHCWGNENGFHKFHPESVASIWFLLLSGLKFDIIISCNEFIANLPFLKDNNKVISGFENIVIYLKDKFNPDDEFSAENKLISMGLRSLVNEKINCITQYTLFLNKENYENYSRGLFKKLLPFPMQYAPPLQYKNEATQLCLQLGLNPDNGLVIREGDNRFKEILETEKKLNSTPSMGALHQSQQKFQLNKLLFEKSTVNNMRAIDLFDNYMSQILELRTEIGTVDKPYILGDKISTADILLFAHITAQTIPELPNQFMKIAIQYKYPDLLQNLSTFTKDVESKLERVKVKTPNNHDYPSLYNYCKYQLGYI